MGLKENVKTTFKKTQEELDEKYNRGVEATKRNKLTVEVAALADGMVKMDEKELLQNKESTFRKLRRVLVYGSVIVTPFFIGIPVKMIDDAIQRKVDLNNAKEYDKIYERELLWVRQEIASERKKGHDVKHLMEYEQSLRSSKAKTTAYIKTLEKKEKETATKESFIFTDKNALPPLQRFAALEATDFNSADEYDSALTESFRCMLHMANAPECVCPEPVSPIDNSEPDITIDLDARKSAFIRSDSILMKRIMSDKGLFNSVDRSCGMGGKSCFLSGDFNTLSMFNFDLHKNMKVKGEQDVAVRNFNKKLTEAVNFVNQKLSDTEYEICKEGSWDKPVLVLAYQGVSSVMESATKYASFEEFCDHIEDPYELYNWLTRSKVKHDSGSKNIVWPDDVIRTRSASNISIALLVHYWAERKGLENYIGVCTYVGKKDGNLGEIITKCYTIVKTDDEETPYSMVVYDSNDTRLIESPKGPEEALKSYAKTSSRAMARKNGLVETVTSIMSRTEIGYIDSIYGKPYPLKKYMSEKQHFQTHIDAVNRATGDDVSSKSLIGEGYLPLKFSDVVTEGITQTAQDIVRKGVNTARKVVPNEGPVKSLDRMTEPLDNIVNTTIDDFRSAMKSDKRDEIVEGKFRIKLTRVIGKCIAYGALGVMVHPAVAAIAFLGKMAYDKNLDSKERGKIINDLHSELNIVKEKIKDADSKGDNENKYKLMRIENQLERQIARIQYKDDNI